MHFTAALVSLWISTCALASPVLEKRSGIPQATYDNLVRYTKYSSGAYTLVCVKPLGNTLVESFSNALTDTQGYIARDDTRKEIVVAFRGSEQPTDFLTDAEILQIPLKSPGMTNVGNAYAHSGFLDAYNSVASNIISTVKSQLAAHPGYTLISTGHSLGGALASLGGLSLKYNFPSASVKMYTFGQPRTGNPAYAALVDSIVGTGNIWRGVHTFDGVPTIIPEAIGYRHHGTEFWQFVEPADAADVKQCSGDEDPTCSDSIPSTGINIAHITYFGQAIALDPSVCL